MILSGFIICSHADWYAPDNLSIKFDYKQLMFYKSFDEFFERLEDLLASDPVTSRLVIKYSQRKKTVSISLRSDKKVVSHVLRDKVDAKKLEAVIYRTSEVLCNKKVDDAKAETAEQKADGKKKKKEIGRAHV